MGSRLGVLCRNGVYREIRRQARKNNDLEPHMIRYNAEDNEYLLLWMWHNSNGVGEIEMLLNGINPENEDDGFWAVACGENGESIRYFGNDLSLKGKLTVTLKGGIVPERREKFQIIGGGARPMAGCGKL